MSEQDFRTFDEFWPFYVKEHQKKTTRILHFIGTTGAMACLAGGLLTKRRWLLAVAPVVGYGPAWISHFFVEGNKPASFKHPLWSLRADLVKWSKMVRFQMSDEVERVLREEHEQVAAEREAEARQATDGNAPAGSPSEVVN
ncbi:MAG: hypothetical protein QOI41_6421 [Myxococcales bacterium]|jgi:hypothetical protein|nr:hypothetical protein [Myxococcales bacterium]